MTDKKLSRSMEILEVVIQMITFYSAFMAVYFGALQKPVSQLWKSLIIFVFVAAAYYSRRKIKLFKPFIVLHIAIIAAAFFMGTTDAERFSYFLIAALIAGYSIRLKTITLQKKYFCCSSVLWRFKVLSLYLQRNHFSPKIIKNEKHETINP